MDPDLRLSIAVLYCHALLGEGIARLLAAEPGADVEYATCAEPERVEAALAGQPDVVVVERCPSFDTMQVLGQVPDALVIDIGIGPGPTWVYRRQEIPGDPNAILRLVRRLRGGHPIVALDQPAPTMADLALVPPGA